MIDLSESHSQHNLMVSLIPKSASHWWSALKAKLQIASPESFDSWEHRAVVLPVYEDDENDDTDVDFGDVPFHSSGNHQGDLLTQFFGDEKDEYFLSSLESMHLHHSALVDDDEN